MERRRAETWLPQEFVFHTGTIQPHPVEPAGARRGSITVNDRESDRQRHERGAISHRARHAITDGAENRCTRAGAQCDSETVHSEIKSLSGTESGTELLKTGWRKRG